MGAGGDFLHDCSQPWLDFCWNNNIDVSLMKGLTGEWECLDEVVESKHVGNLPKRGGGM